MINHAGDVGAHARPKHVGFLLNLQPRESEIVDAVFQSEKSIRGEPVESCKLRYFNSFEFFDHTGRGLAVFANRQEARPTIRVEVWRCKADMSSNPATAGLPSSSRTYPHTLWL